MTGLGRPKKRLNRPTWERESVIAAPPRNVTEGQSFPSKSGATATGPRPSSVAILDCRSRRLSEPTISRPDHKAGIVIRAGGEIGFDIGQLLPLQFKLGLEGESFANTWLIGG